MKTAYVFPGQGSQYPGMGKDLIHTSPDARVWLEKADAILGYSISDIMINGNEEDLKQTRITQPAVFLHSVIRYLTASPSPMPDMVAGHSLGEFSALVAAGVLNFESALKLVYARAIAMQKACEINPSTMAAVLNLEDETVERICKEISSVGEIVVAANYNCPGQLVISGTVRGIEKACEDMKAAGAKRALVLQVGGAFHSPLMAPAAEELEEAIRKTSFSDARCPVYQNVDAAPHISADEIRQGLIRQLTSPVLWTQTIRNMHRDGAVRFIECGPGKVLQGLVKKIIPEAEATGL
jgi:[acyl-carrier-protein] S-malonyltransferase